MERFFYFSTNFESPQALDNRSPEPIVEFLRSFFDEVELEQHEILAPEPAYFCSPLFDIPKLIPPDKVYRTTYVFRCEGLIKNWAPIRQFEDYQIDGPYGCRFNFIWTEQNA